MNSKTQITTDKPTEQTYDEFQYAYDYYNEKLFNSRLPQCLITLQRGKRFYGYFSHKRFVNRDKTLVGEIALNPEYFAVVSVEHVLSTLVHEMVHVEQCYFGKPGRRGYHNTEWANMMDRIGLMASSTAAPGGSKTGEKVSHYIIDGGKFDCITKELINSGFTVSWMDRFPVREVPEHNENDLNLVDESKKSSPMALTSQGLISLIHGRLPTQNRSNRIKYRCPSCYSQVWGKPDLQILCGSRTCDQESFEEIE